MSKMDEKLPRNYGKRSEQQHIFWYRCVQKLMQGWTLTLKVLMGYF